MTIYAHRGWHGAGAPENSMAAFRRAADGGFGIETDLRTDRDGRIVLFHDRVAGGAPVDVLTRDDVARHAGRPVPTLDDLLAAGFDVPLNLEVKTRAAWAALAPYVARGLPDAVLISSFVHPVARAAAAQGLEAAYLLASAPAPDRLPVRSERLGRIVWDFNIVDRALLDAAAAGGFASTVYGALTPDEHRWLATSGCDAVITDTPDLAFRAAEHAANALA